VSPDSPTLLSAGAWHSFCFGRRDSTNLTTMTYARAKLERSRSCGEMVLGIVRHPERDFSIPKCALPPSHNPVRDFHFRGRKLFQIERLWNDQFTVGSHLDGEIFERVALYNRTRSLHPISFLKINSLVVQLERTNHRAIYIVGRTVNDENPIPFFSISREFFSEKSALIFIARFQLFPVSNINVSDVTPIPHPAITRVPA